MKMEMAEAVGVRVERGVPLAVAQAKVAGLEIILSYLGGIRNLLTA